MNIAILGTGPAAIASAVLLRKNNNVIILTRSEINTKQTHQLTLYTNKHTLTAYEAFHLYNSPEADDFIINKADIILVTVPTHAVHKTLANLADQINQATRKREIQLGLIYGQGDINYLLPNTINRNINLGLFATAFLPWIAKRDPTTEQINVKLYGVEQFNLIYATTMIDFNFIKQNLYKQLSDVTYAYTPYSASVALASDNMLLHPPRLIQLFGQTWSQYKDVPSFYRNYGVLEQIVFTELEKEIYSLKLYIENLLGLGSEAYLLSYKVFEELNYQDFDIQTYTHKEHTTASKAPTVYDPENNCYKIDTNHRYFKDDFEYGLFYVKLLAQTYTFDTPIIDKLLSWAEQNIGPINEGNPYLSRIIKFQ
nr:MAG TPA: NAD/NADP octopine/nopaline dehydrogenase, alpha-helical domain [Bacteriophage sp.]